MNKAHILAEIRRTTKENGGQPLGARRFSQETGIDDKDWNGKYWARWGDALKEAGYEPNKFNAAYSPERRFEPYIKLTRELGRFPVYRELKMKASVDKTFPSPGAFERRGSKDKLIAELSEYCREKSGCEDILALCEPVLQGQGRVAISSKEQSVEMGFVYLIKSLRYYKIGRSNSAGRREYELTIQLPEKANTVHTIRTDDPVGIEAYWHKRFESKRKNGEWFDLSSADVSAFKRHKSFM